MTGILKTILFLLVIYYVWKLLFRLFFPVVVKKVVENAQRTMEERMNQSYQQTQQRAYADQEGEVIIQKGVKPIKTGVSDSDGDYVEFEEVK